MRCSEPEHFQRYCTCRSSHPNAETSFSIPFDLLYHHIWYTSIVFSKKIVVSGTFQAVNFRRIFWVFVTCGKKLKFGNKFLVIAFNYYKRCLVIFFVNFRKKQEMQPILFKNDCILSQNINFFVKLHKKQFYLQ